MATGTVDWECGEPSGLVPIENDHRLFVSFYGPDRAPGAPIVIFIPGVTCSITEWVAVRRQLQPTTRTLLYERAGMGASDESSKPPTAYNMALELESLLKSLAIAPPYVVVCHSYGGIISREFTELIQKNKHGEDLAGIVFVDANQEKSTALWPDLNLEAIRQGLDWFSAIGLSQSRVLTDAEWQAVLDEQATDKHQRTAAREMEHYIASCAALGERHQFERDPPLLNNCPISVLMAHPELDLRKAFDAGVAAGNGTPEQRLQLSKKLSTYSEVHSNIQQEILKLSTKHKFVDVEGHGHFVHITAPEAVVKEVNWVLDNV